MAGPPSARDSFTHSSDGHLATGRNGRRASWYIDLPAYFAPPQRCYGWGAGVRTGLATEAQIEGEIPSTAVLEPLPPVIDKHNWQQP